MANEVLGVDQMRRADAAAVQFGVDSFALMQAAGRAVAQAVVQRWSVRPVAVLCGPGNNGGDGLVAAAALRALGWSVSVFTHADPAQWTGDALRAAQQWQAGVADPAQAWRPLGPACLDGAALVIDALFGAGLTRPLDVRSAQVLAQARQRRLPVVAVDVPSGVLGDTGTAQGAVPAHTTVTFFRCKPAHLLMPAKALCGEVLLRDIGVPASVLSALGVQTWANGPLVWMPVWPWQAADAHKHQRGHAWVWGGARMTGAARLAALSAARMGAGLTTVCVPPQSEPIYAAALTSVMVEPMPGLDEAAWPAHLRARLPEARCSALLIGPGAQAGIAPGTLQALVLTVLGAGRPVVLDADALSVFQDAPQTLFDAIAAHARPVVLTPHEGEFVRLFGPLASAASDDKLTRARAAARRSGAVVVLKGHDTVVAAPDGRAVINQGAPATLATAGSGDVLAGCIVGLLAQDMPAWQAAAAACWVHGQAAQAFGGAGLIADDLPGFLPQVLQRLPWPR